MRLAIDANDVGQRLSKLSHCAISALFLAAVTASAAEESFPFKAFVARDRTQLRSGPGDDHYSTDELPRGAEVEVFRRVDGGWLAVRPPETSFSWVAQRDVRITDQAEIAEVIGTTAVSWIGSSVRDVADHRWLVKLDRGETVSLLGRERRRMLADDKSDVYCKIAPPAGEFRWLHEDDVVREKGELDAIQDPQVDLADFRVALRGTPRGEPPQDATAADKPAPADAKKDGFISRDKHSPAPGQSAGELALIPKRGNRSAISPKSDDKSKLVPTGDLESQLRALDAQLSLIAAQPAESWNFAGLRASAEQLAASGKTTLDRARVQLFLDKIAEFDGLKSRHALMAPKPAPTGPAPKLGAAKSARSSAESGVDPRFDGTGWLLPVHSSKQGSPPYALLDQDGNILQFVSPSPGLNLHRYLRKEIGVFGQKDQAPTLDKPHLTAQRIVELDRHRK